MSFNCVWFIIFVLQVTFMETIGSMLAHTVVMTHFTQRNYYNYFFPQLSLKRLKNEIRQIEKYAGRNWKILSVAISISLICILGGYKVVYVN